MLTPLPRLADVKWFPAIVIALVIVLGLMNPASADDGDWSEFGFDSSSDSYRVKRERVFDLRSGRYSTPALSQTQAGDFITLSGFNPLWVTLTTVDREKILFSNSAAGGIKVDETAERMSNCVPIHYGDSYVASFEDRNYTIKLVEGSYESPDGRAGFLYRSGGVRGPEHEPRKVSARGKRKSGPRLESNGDAGYDGEEGIELESSSAADYDEKSLIKEVTVTIITPHPKNEDSPESHPLSLSLNTSYEGGFSSKNQDDVGGRGGQRSNFHFQKRAPRHLQREDRLRR